ncbi:DUF6752 domain-containing protein [Nocardioides lijunqiniae]|uniref:DUF6752 domain-containing protein n=1 Tax=Nocardioides lijunqiniae TaxID=2760832 RepID=UPI001877EF99|nr:DUF6752 domain-containing protein [Nocardioides lijunqiniae]
MESMKKILSGRSTMLARIRALEDEVQECRQLNVRLAELCDVVTELLVPLADRDEAAVRELLDCYRADVGDPLPR